MQAPQSWIKGYFLVGMIAALSACGGGSSSSSNPPPSDTTPNAFSFTAVEDAEPGADVTSNAITVSGIDTETSISVADGEYLVNDEPASSGDGTVEEGDSVAVQVTAADETNTPVEATLSIGGVTGTFTVTTLPDTTPESFSFSPENDAEPESVHVSNPITVSDIDVAAPISIEGGEYRIGEGEFTSSAGTVEAGQEVSVRITASEAPSTEVDTVLTIGGVDGTYSVTTLEDTTAPEAAITFPPPMSATEAETLLVRGTAQDDYSDIETVEISVNDGEPMLVDPADDLADWTVTVEGLAEGENTITVKTTDSLGNEEASAAQVEVHQQPFEEAFPDNDVPLSRVRGLTFDALNDRVLISNQPVHDPNTIIAVDMATSTRSVLSGPNEPDGENPFSAPRGLAVDAPRGRALLVDAGEDYILDVDLNSGARSVLSSATVPDGNQPSMPSPQGLAIDPSNPDLGYLADSRAGSLSRLDLLTGKRTLISDNTMPDTGPLFESPANLIIDSKNNRALVTDLDARALFAVDLDTGVRTIVSESDETGSFFPDSVATDDFTRRVFVSDGLHGVISVDLETGERTQVYPEFGAPGGDYHYLHYAPGSAYILWLDRSTQGLYAFDIESKSVVTVSKSAP